jgi:hypothetical protein
VTSNERGRRYKGSKGGEEQERTSKEELGQPSARLKRERRAAERPWRTLEGDLVFKVGVVQDLVGDLAAEVLLAELLVLELEVVADGLAGEADLVVEPGAIVGRGPPIEDGDREEEEDEEDRVDGPRAGEEGERPLEQLGREQDERDVVPVVEGGRALGGQVGRRDDALGDGDRVRDSHGEDWLG